MSGRHQPETARAEPDAARKPQPQPGEAPALAAIPAVPEVVTQLGADGILALQRAAGNRAVTRLIQRVGPVITAPTDPGRSSHPTLELGRDNNPEAVMELKQKLALSRGEAWPANPDPAFTEQTRDEVTAYQQSEHLLVDGIVGRHTWRHLDRAGASTVGRIERPWRETVGGRTFRETSRYSWRIEPDRILVSAGITFVADPADPPANLATLTAGWKQSILDRWNRFRAVKTGTSESRRIVFEIPERGGNTVTVSAGDGVSDSGHWFALDMAHFPNVPAHEFGHLIALEDEYQRPEAAYRRLHPGATGAEVRGARVAPGQYTDQSSLMGQAALNEHDVVTPEPRHVREFVRFIQEAEGGEWEAQA